MSVEHPYVCTACRLNLCDQCNDLACWCNVGDHAPDDGPEEAA